MSEIRNAKERTLKCVGYTPTEDLALMLGLLFRTRRTTRSHENMRAVAECIEAMGRKLVAYRLEIAMHHKQSRRVTTALQSLLTELRK